MRIEVHSPDGVGEIDTSTDLVETIRSVVNLRDGDVLVITSKVISKAEGRVLEGDREAAIRAETVRVVARRGQTAIVENTLGLVMAAAGVDASNVTPGRLVLLPLDPDATARSVRESLLIRTGANVAVLISDTSGRAWRVGQTDIAIGCAGMLPAQDLSGGHDHYGNALMVTEPAVADEITGVAELSSGKLGGRPLTVLRGLGDRVLPAHQHGPGARSLQRPPHQDMFAMGTREAVEAAVRRDPTHFGTPAPLPEFSEALARCEVSHRISGDAVSVPAGDLARADVLALAYGWCRTDDSLLFERRH